MLTLKKFLKYSLFFLGIIAVLLLFVAGCFWVSTEQRRRQAVEDEEKYSKQCDSVITVTEQPEIKFSGFQQKEIRQLQFKILRNGQVVQDTLVKSNFSYISDDSMYCSVKIPYPVFLKTDTIVVTTGGALHYYISGYHHGAYLHYGMMGYVGSHDCRLAEAVVINNEPAPYGTLVKNDGWLHPEKDILKQIILPQTPAFDSISGKSPVSYEKAQEIFGKNKRNKHLVSQILYRIEMGEEGGFYVFGEEDENNRHQVDIVKINMQTGACSREKR
ncbi:hypothetical protein SAMN04488128_1011327 [Chitinophaga eiseniae]|uniref:Uncharacterized protein n=1 Tax=Chitinophaga eiseniae TaxID=634771 RepID=A0A1T4MY26_9BACT|nr:hypothetical protein [Chitinophaga eiseniae]SJZ71697.1 hypothetical protein SAMN04488128_1011327 [Chitinophaga eiseniae]